MNLMAVSSISWIRYSTSMARFLAASSGRFIPNDSAASLTVSWGDHNVWERGIFDPDSIVQMMAEEMVTEKGSEDEKICVDVRIF